jgi:hypothetical protein
MYLGISGLAIRATQSDECHNPDKGNSMTTFYISRKMQLLLILEGCGGHDTESRERRLKVAKFIQTLLPDEQFEPSDLYSYDLSLLLEKLNGDDHGDVFEAYLNLF